MKQVTLRYGVGSSLRLDLADSALLGHLKGPEKPTIEPATATHQALVAPLEFPPLVQITVPGDRVVLAVDGNMPQVETVLNELVDVLVHGNTEAADITVLLPAAPLNDPLSKLPESLRHSITVAVHDSEDRKQLSYLAATTTDQRVYLNRLLTDADVVLPVGCMRFDTLLGWHGTFSGLYPLYSDAETQRRFRQQELQAIELGPQPLLRKEVDEVGWLLGVLFVVQAVPSQQQGVYQLLAGDAVRVLAAGGETLQQNWNYIRQPLADVVVATLDEPAEGQTWHALGRALAAAVEVVRDQGAIVVCCDLNDQTAQGQLGPALQWLSRSEATPTVLRRIVKQLPPDSIPAFQLARAVEKAQVYLLSQLSPSVVEELGMAPATHPSEVTRLVERHGHCLILENAARMRVSS